MPNGIIAAMADPQRLREYYRALGDDALAAAFREGQQAYEGDAWAVIAAEVKARGLDPNAEWAASTASNGGSPAPERPRMSDADRNELLARLRRRSLVNRVIAVIGIVVTIGSYFMAIGGGTYYVAWGAMLFGAVNALLAELSIAKLTRATR